MKRDKEEGIKGKVVVKLPLRIVSNAIGRAEGIRSPTSNIVCPLAQEKNGALLRRCVTWGQLSRFISPLYYNVPITVWNASHLMAQEGKLKQIFRMAP